MGGKTKGSPVITSTRVVRLAIDATARAKTLLLFMILVLYY